MPGQHVRKGALLGYLMAPEKLLARVVVTQDDIDLVRTRLSHASLRLSESLGEVHPVSTIRELAERDGRAAVYAR